MKRSKKIIKKQIKYNIVDPNSVDEYDREGLSEIVENFIDPEQIDIDITLISINSAEKSSLKG